MHVTVHHELQLGLVHAFGLALAPAARVAALATSSARSVGSSGGVGGGRTQSVSRVRHEWLRVCVVRGVCSVRVAVVVSVCSVISEENLLGG